MYKYIEKNYDEMKKYYLMAIELNNSNVIKLCKNIVIFMIITCPITLDEINICYEIKKCNHKFSEEIFKVSKCPLCRCII